MSTYVREKVLRIPQNMINFEDIINDLQKKHPDDDVRDDLGFYLETDLGDLFGYAEVGKFQLAPTEKRFIDYVLDHEYDCEGDYGKVHDLYESEKAKFKPIFQKLDEFVNMDFVKLVEFCWYNATEAPDYYDVTDNDFYRSLT